MPPNGLPADCPILRIVTVGTLGFKGVPANSRRRTSGFPAGAPLLKSAALPIELTTRTPFPCMGRRELPGLGAVRVYCHHRRFPPVLAAGAVRAQHRLEQSRETSLQVLCPKRQVSLAAVGASVHHAGLAKHTEVVREGRLGDPELEVPAAALPLGGKVADYRQPGRV